MEKISLDQIELTGKRLFIRVDFNVPMKDRKVTDRSRIEAAAPTIRHAIEHGARIALASHLGRPKGTVKPEFSLEPIIPELEKLIGARVKFAPDVIGPEREKILADLADGEVALLENLRFHPGEEKNDPDFAKALAEGVDIYVNDAFGTAHRAHASTEGITKFAPLCAAGFLMKREIDYFNRLMSNPRRPVAIVVGGAKASTKLALIENIIERADIIIIGGAMAFTFIKALGREVGSNLLEADMIEKVGRLIERAKEMKRKFFLPVDFLIAESIDAPSAAGIVTWQSLDGPMVAPDIGPATIALFKSALAEASTVALNGPMGVFENRAFGAGTYAILQAIVDGDNVSIVGGGDSVAAVNQFGFKDKFDHISTGGGAFLEALEGKTLPGIAALTDRK